MAATLDIDQLELRFGLQNQTIPTIRGLKVGDLLVRSSRDI